MGLRLILSLLLPNLTGSLMAGGAACELSLRTRFTPSRMGWADAQRKRKERDAAAYQQQVKAAEAEAEKNAAEAAAAQRRASEEEEARRAEQARYTDEVDFYRPGGVMKQPTNILTIEGLQRASQSISPAVRAEQALQEVTKKVANMSSEEARQSLRSTLDMGRAAGVDPRSPQFKKAAAVLAALERASEDAGAADVTPNALNDKMNAIFSDAYAIPDDD